MYDVRLFLKLFNMDVYLVVTTPVCRFLMRELLIQLVELVLIRVRK